MRDEVTQWIDRQRSRAMLKVEALDWSACRDWRFDNDRIAHSTGGYFSVVGVEDPCHGSQTILLDQPEVGLLGFLYRRSPGGIEFLVQAKAEPGNQGGVQLAPSVQATASNIMRRHGGEPTRFLSYFDRAAIAANTLQSEQGTRFRNKRNRNAIAEVCNKDFDLGANACWSWMKAPVLKRLLLENYTVNTDARSVLASGPWQLLSGGAPVFSDAAQHDEFGIKLRRSVCSGEASAGGCTAVIRRLQVARRNLCKARVIPLNKVRGWCLTRSELRSVSAPHLYIRPYQVAVNDREIPEWCQPLYGNDSTIDIVLVCQMQDGILHFLFKLTRELGLYNGVELGPSWQSGDIAHEHWRSLLLDTGAHVHCSVMQSDEGGRFHLSRAAYKIVELESGAKIPASADSVWLTLHQVRALARCSEIFDNEARSLISMLLAYV